MDKPYILVILLTLELEKVRDGGTSSIVVGHTAAIDIESQHGR